MVLKFSRIEVLARELGLDLIQGYTKCQAEEILRKELGRLRAWQEQGRAGEMGYMLRSPDLFAALDEFLPDTESVLCFLIPYHQQLEERGVRLKPAPFGSGRVARYAWGRDYHRQIKRKLQQLFQKLDSEMNRTVAWRSFADAVPLLERSLARASGKGFIGRNSMFIQPGVGSYAFLAEVLYGAPIEMDSVLETKLNFDAPGSGCGSCVRCESDCPTGAIVGNGVLDARRCISYLTIEKRGVFSEWERRALGDWIFGCDICQDVCPFNHSHTEVSRIPEFEPSFGAGQYLSFTTLFSLKTPAEFESRFAGTPLMRAGREGLLRNACSAIANTRYYPALPDLVQLLKGDESPVLRTEAEASLRALFPDATGHERRLIKNTLGM